MKSSYIIREKLPQDQPALEAIYEGYYPHPQLLPKITLIAERDGEVMGSICADFFNNDLYVFLSSKKGHYSGFMASRLLVALEFILKKAGATSYFFLVNEPASDPRWLKLVYEFSYRIAVLPNTMSIFHREIK